MNDRHEGNGDLSNKGGSGDTMYQEENNSFEHHLRVQQIVNQAQRVREEVIDKVKRDIVESLDAFVADVEIINQSIHDENINISFSTDRNKHSFITLHKSLG
ncbi:hypothetical protein ACF0H5_018597 [Mactra antiquata]